jgi:hypothetical protein
MKAKRRFLSGVLGIAIGLGLLASCGKKDDPINQAEKKDATKGIAAPSIAETKAIAEEGFIYLVMRLYWPKTEPPSILPPGEGTWQPPAIKQAS